MARKILLICGIFSSLLYVGADLFALLRYEGYSYTAQTVSELSAIGAPTRSVLVPLYVAYDALLIAFGLGLLGSARSKRTLRITAGLIAGIGVVGFVAMPFPMHVRGQETTLTDVMHIVLTGVIVLLTLLAMGFGATAYGKRFRLFSIVTILAVIVFGVLTGLDGPRVAANLPTPWIGVTERLNIGAYLLWVLVLALTALRAEQSAPDHRRENARARTDIDAGGGPRIRAQGLSGGARSLHRELLPPA
jgi:hypothetical protein